MAIVDVLIIVLASFCGTIAGIGISFGFLWYKKTKILERLSDEIFNETMLVIQDKIQTSDVVDVLIDQTFQGLMGRFGGDKAGNRHQEKAVDRKIVKAVLGTNPVLGALADQIGIMPYLEKNPNLIFYIMHKYPGLMQIGMGGASETPQGLSPPPLSPPPMPSPSQS